MNGLETSTNLFVFCVMIWMSSGLITAFVAYAWARRPFNIKDFSGFLLLGPIVPVCVLVLTAGYWIISRWLGRRTFL